MITPQMFPTEILLMLRPALILATSLLSAITLIGSSASADLITMLDVSVSPTGGAFLYEYTLTNSASSDLAVVLFGLSVAPEADLTSIMAPVGWSASYTAGDSSIAWESESLLSDIAPGAFGLFSFRSPLPPVLTDFLIVGLDESAPRIESNQGTIAGPGVNAVPEPSSILLSCLGTLCILGYARRHKGPTT